MVLMAADGARITVYLLDDHQVVREGLKVMLEASGRVAVVGESESAEDAVRRIPALHPDVAILDARLPDGSGIEVCRAIRSVDADLKALILTSYDDDEACSPPSWPVQPATSSRTSRAPILSTPSSGSQQDSRSSIPR